MDLDGRRLLTVDGEGLLGQKLCMAMTEAKHEHPQIAVAALGDTFYCCIRNRYGG